MKEYVITQFVSGTRQYRVHAESEDDVLRRLNEDKLIVLDRWEDIEIDDYSIVERKGISIFKAKES